MRKLRKKVMRLILFGLTFNRLYWKEYIFLLSSPVDDLNWKWKNLFSLVWYIWAQRIRKTWLFFTDKYIFHYHTHCSYCDGFRLFGNHKECEEEMDAIAEDLRQDYY